jgi:hypothetical protein
LETAITTSCFPSAYSAALQSLGTWRGGAARDSLLGVFYRIEKPLHPGFFAGCGVFFDNTLSGGAVDLLDHILKSRFGLPHLFFLGQKDKFLNAGPYRALCRLIPKPAAFTLPVTLFRGTALTCQKITLHGTDARQNGRLPEPLFI